MSYLIPLETLQVTGSASIGGSLTVSGQLSAAGFAPGTIPGTAIKTDADENKVPLSALRSEVIEALSGALSAADYLGEVTALSQSIPAASGNAGKWFACSVAGTLTDPDAGSLAVSVGDRIVSDGSSWLRYPAPPTNIPDGSVTRLKLDGATKTQIDTLEISPKIRRRFSQPTLAFVIDSQNGRRLMSIDLEGKVSFLPAPSIIPFSALANDAAQRFPRRTFIPSTGKAAEVVVGDRVIATVAPDGALDFRPTPETVSRFVPGVSAGLGPQVKRTFLLGGRVFEIAAQDAAGNLRAAFVLNSIGASDAITNGPPDAITGQQHLDQWFEFATRRRLGESVTYVLNCIGDSWTWLGQNWVHWMTKRLQAQYGSAGPGYVSFCPTSADTGSPPTTVGDFADNDAGGATRTGTSWTKSNYDGRGPDVLETTGTTVGDRVTVTLAVACNTIRLHYLRKPGGGELRWRIGAGAWTNVSTANGFDAYATIDINVTGQATPFTIDFEVLTSGSTGVTLFGAEAIATTPGVRVNRLGHSGARASHFSGAPATWAEGVALIAPNGTISSFGTNDQVGAVSFGAFSSQCETIATRLRSIQAGHDIIYMSPWENGASRATPISVYDLGAYQASMTQSAAMISLPRIVAPDPNSYGSNTPTPWMQYPGSSDTLHPSARGHKLIAGWVLRCLDSLN